MFSKTTKAVYRFEYKMNRYIHGPVVSAILAVYVVLKPAPF